MDWCWERVRASSCRGGLGDLLRAPVNLSLPQIDDTAPTVGAALTASPGVWSGVPTSYNYQWFDDESPIAGATGSFYIVSEGDIGHQLVVQVSASNPIGTGVAASATTGVVPSGTFNSGSPSLSNDNPNVADTIECSQGTWSGSPISFVYQWYANGAPLSDATSSAYVVQAGDVGSTFYCVVTAFDGSSSSTVQSETTGTVPNPVNSAPVLSSSGDINNPANGDVLTVDSGSYSGDNSPMSFSYQWYHQIGEGGAPPLDGQTGNTLFLSSVVPGQMFYCVVKANYAGAGSLSVTSNSTGPVPD